MALELEKRDEEEEKNLQELMIQFALFKEQIKDGIAQKTFKVETKSIKEEQVQVIINDMDVESNQVISDKTITDEIKDQNLENDGSEKKSMISLKSEIEKDDGYVEDDEGEEYEDEEEEIENFTDDTSEDEIEENERNKEDISKFICFVFIFLFIHKIKLDDPCSKSILNFSEFESFLIELRGAIGTQSRIGLIYLFIYLFDSLLNPL